MRCTSATSIGRARLSQCILPEADEVHRLTQGRPEGERRILQRRLAAAAGAAAATDAAAAATDAFHRRARVEHGQAQLPLLALLLLPERLLLPRSGAATAARTPRFCNMIIVSYKACAE